MRTCSICSHAKRAAIDQQLVIGTSFRTVAEQYGTSATALHRHKQHLAKHLVKAEEAAQVADAGTLLDQVKRLLSNAQRLTVQAEHAEQLDVAIRGIREVRGVLELLAKLSGELQSPSVQVGIKLKAPVEDVRAKLAARLAGYARASKSVQNHQLLEPPRSITH